MLNGRTVDYCVEIPIDEIIFELAQHEYPQSRAQARQKGWKTAIFTGMAISGYQRDGSVGFVRGSQDGACQNRIPQVLDRHHLRQGLGRQRISVRR